MIGVSTLDNLDLLPRRGVSVVYFIAHGDDAVKIGFATDAIKRLRALQTATPVTLRMIRALPGVVEDESEFHGLLKEFHLTGGWFSRKGKLAEFLRATCVYDPEWTARRAIDWFKEGQHAIGKSNPRGPKICKRC